MESKTKMPKVFEFAIQCIQSNVSSIQPAAPRTDDIYSSLELSRYSVRLTPAATAWPTPCPVSRSAMKAEYCEGSQP